MDFLFWTSLENVLLFFVSGTSTKSNAPIHKKPQV